MADWRRRSIAGGPSPSGALHLDFFYRPSAGRIPFPCHGAGGTSKIEAAIRSTPEWTLANAFTDDSWFLAADGDSKMAVASPATTNEASPLQPRQRQPVGTAATGGGGSGSRRQLSFDADHVVVFLDYDEDGEEKKKEVSLLCDEVLDEEDDEDEDGADDEEEEEDDEDEDGADDEEEEEDDEDEDGADDEEEEEDDEDEDGADDEEEEEEEPQGPVMCRDCGIVEASLMLVPCRHVCYCADCYRIAGYKTGPAGVRCLVCGKIAKRKHSLSGRLEPRKKSTACSNVQLCSCFSSASSWAVSVTDRLNQSTDHLC